MADRRFTLLYRYSTDYGVTWHNISDAVDSQQTKITHNLCTNNFTSAKDEATFVMPATKLTEKKDFVEALLGTSKVLVEIRGTVEKIVWDGDDVLWNGNKVGWREFDTWFIGYVDKSSVDLKSYPLPVSVAVRLQDVSVLHLDDAPKAYILYENYTVSAIVRALLSHAGYSYDSSLDAGTGVLAVNGDDSLKEAFVIDKADKTTYRQYIDLLLFEAGGYVLDFTEDGTARVVRLPWESPVPTRMVDNPMIVNGVNTRSTWLANDGVSLKWSTLKWSATDQILWMDSISRSLDNHGNVLAGETVHNDRYWPDGGEITPTFMEYQAEMLDKPYLTRESRKQNKDLSIIMAKNVYAYIQATKNGQAFTNWAYDIPADPEFAEFTTNPTAYPKKAWWLLHNTSGADVDIQFFTLRGTALYRAILNTMLTDGSENPKEYESTYIFNETEAKRFIDFYWHFLQTSRHIMSWSEPYQSEYLNTVVSVQHKGQDTAVLGVIVSKTIHFINEDTPVFDYQAVGVSTFSSQNVIKTSDVPDGSSRQGQKGDKGDPGVTPDTYTLESSMTGILNGTLQVRIYKNGTFDTSNTYYVQAEYRYNGIWSNLSGWQPKTVTGGTASEILTADAVRLKLYAESSMTTLLTTGFVSYGETGSPGTPGSVWYYGTVLTGTGTATGVAGNVGDGYLNTDTYNTYECTTAGDSSTAVWTYTGNLKGAQGDPGTPALVFDFSMSAETYNVNLRSHSGNNDAISLVSDIQGYSPLSPDPATSWAVVDADGNGHNTWLSSTTGDSVTLTIPLKNTAKWPLSVTMSKTGYHTPVTKTLTGIDVTEYDFDLGVWSSTTLPSYIDSPTDSLEVLDGDFFVAGDINGDGTAWTGSDSQAYTPGVPYIRRSSSWHNAMTATTENTERMLKALGSILNSPLAVPSATALYGWFGNLVAQNAVIDSLTAQQAFITSLFAKAIEISNPGYIKGGTRYANNGDIANWNADGFWFGSDGRLKASLQSDDNGNTFVGTGVSKAYATVGKLNTAVGYHAMYSDAGSQYNVAIGNQALYSVTTNGNNNIAIGYYAMFHNTSGRENVAIGSSALVQNTTGIHNIAVGYTALLSNTTGDRNIAIGANALDAHTSGSDDIAIGVNALTNDSTGYQNVGIGNSALRDTTTGHDNTALGYLALSSVTTGTYNLGLGHDAMDGLTTGSYNIGLGYKSAPYSISGSRQINLNDAFIGLEFKSGRTFSQLFSVLSSYFPTTGRSVSCIGTINGDPINKMEYQYDSNYGFNTVTLSGIGSTTYTLYNGSSTTLTGRMVIMFANPKMYSDSSSDCLG